VPYCVFAVVKKGNSKKKNNEKIPHARRIKEKRETEVARGNEVFNLRRRSNMSTTTKRGIRLKIFFWAEQFSFHPLVQICARLLRVPCAHTSGRTTRAAKTPVIARILQRLPTAFFSSFPSAPTAFYCPTG